jgi:predicted TIM-barrel fold metal-dependent hydrolase
VDGTYRFFGYSAVSMPMTPEFFDIGKKIDDMDRNGLDVAVLSLSIRGPDRVGLAKIVNDELAEIVAQRPKRFLGYATLGFGKIDGSFQELDRCFSQLKFRGLQLFSNINGKPLDSLEFRPLFARLDELKRAAFVHPNGTVESELWISFRSPPYPSRWIQPWRRSASRCPVCCPPIRRRPLSFHM